MNPRRSNPPGVRWCPGCSELLEQPLRTFGVDQSRWDRLSVYCKLCRKERARQRRNSLNGNSKEV